MSKVDRPLTTLTAGDLMTGAVVRFPEEMPLRDAARVLLRHQIGGGPVVDAQGRCVGVLSAVDFVRLSARREDAAGQTTTSSTCSFQARHVAGDGKEVILCALPPDMCPLQGRQQMPGGERVLICTQPHGVLVDWQLMDLERLPTDEVRRYMTADPVTARPDTRIHALARMMIDAHIHRIIIVDEQQRPVGVISSTDILAALAYSGNLE